MPAAIAVPLITGAAAAGSTIYAANKANSAAKQAAQTQTDAGNRALELQERIYNQQRADAEPYRQMGYGALNALSGFVGLPSGASTATTTGMIPGMKAGPSTGGGMAVDRPGLPQTSMALSALGRMGSSGVLMRAPNGQQKMVPPDQVAHYQQLGAQVVQ